MNYLQSMNNTGLVKKRPEYKGMIDYVKSNMPVITESMEYFGKRQSQFMDNMLTVSHPTPLRNIRQILAEIKNAEEALIEAEFKVKKHNVELKIKRRDLETETDELKRELIQIEIDEKLSQLSSIEYYMSGAIRKIANHIEQYNRILHKHNIKSFDEDTLEREEEEYHIKKAFDQAVTAARSRQGLIDEGNHIYLSQIGINGASAQKDVIDFFMKESEIIKQGGEPGHAMVLEFLENMYKKYKGAAERYSQKKGMTTGSDLATLTKGE